MMRRALALSLAALALTASATASAALTVEAQPVFGAQSLPPNGWSEIAVRIDNPDPQPKRGTIEISSISAYRESAKASVRAAFAVDAHSSAIVLLPVHGQGYGATQTVRALDEKGAVFTEKPFTWTPYPGQLLVDIVPGSRLQGALHDVNLTLSYENGMGSAHVQSLIVGQPKWDSASGDPILPLRSAGFSAATAVLIASDVLVKLQGPELDALTGYTLAGGTLAVVVQRPEDLRHATLKALVGGEPRSSAPPLRLLLAPTESTEAEIPDPPGLGAEPALPEFELQRGPSGPAPPDKPAYTPPAAEVASSFVGFTGGHLEPSAFGATAAHGLGEVHLLAFDPTRSPALDDAWTRGRLADLVTHAWDRRSTRVAPHGASEHDAFAFDVNRQLDPNENARWLILVTGLGLLVYAIAAGPLNFSLAAKKGKPLRALLVLPILSASTFLGIVVVGVLAKGIHGRARHLTIIEAAGGMEKAAARRFRGFFTPRGSELSVRTTDANSVLRLATNDSNQPEQNLLVDRDGASLVDLIAMPWETVVVREDGFASLGAGVSILPSGKGDALIVNRIGRDLRGVIAHIPGKFPVYFSRLRDGETVNASSGLRISVMGSRFIAGKIMVNPFEPLSAKDTLDGDVAGIASAWQAISTTVGRNVDWFPDDAPVILAQLDGGEGTTTDASLKLESDRALLRVIGWGGRP